MASDDVMALLTNAVRGLAEEIKKLREEIERLFSEEEE